MASLLFTEKNHTYTVDGEPVPSVSEITRFLTRELYQDVMQVSLDAAADRGTKIHKAAEALDKYGEIEVSDDILPYLKAYLAFLKEEKPEWEKIEWPVNKGLEYAGTIDRYGTLRGKKGIVDLKSTANIKKNHRVLYTAGQNLYRMAAEEKHPIEALFILQLKKDETYKLIELPIDDELALACLALHNATKKTRRKRKEKTDD